MSQSHTPDPFSPANRASRITTWGSPPEAAVSLGAKIAAQLERTTGSELPSRAESNGVNPQEPRVQIPESRLEGAAHDALADAADIHLDDEFRAAMSLGKSYPDLVIARSGALSNVCDAVVRPTSIDAVRSIVEACAEHELTLIPVGGGSSVVGGVEPLRGINQRPIVSLDMTALSATVNIDSVSRIGTFQAGIIGPQLESSLGDYGLTLGHVPQSFALSTLGGWIATRSAGQQSLRYGKIESMVAGIELVTPAGVMNVDHLPAHAAGPDALQIAMGSEGLFGVITRATMKLSQRPDRVRFATFVCPDFAIACEGARAIVQRGLKPATVRVSDTFETQFSLGASLPSFVPRGFAGKVAHRTGLGEGAMVIVVIPGDHRDALQTEQDVHKCLKAFGAKSLGPTPAKHWYHGRFNQPFVRDELIDRGLIVDTLETAVSWDKVDEVHNDIRSALVSTLGEGNSVVGCHLSHLYRDGVSLYFTFIANAEPGRNLDLWRAAKQNVAKALIKHRAAASHQHAVGTMHVQPYLQTADALSLKSWRTLKTLYDPRGICNPGKVFDKGAGSAHSINAPTLQEVPRELRA